MNFIHRYNENTIAWILYAIGMTAAIIIAALVCRHMSGAPLHAATVEPLPCDARVQELQAQLARYAPVVNWLAEDIEPGKGPTLHWLVNTSRIAVGKKPYTSDEWNELMAAEHQQPAYSSGTNGAIHFVCNAGSCEELKP
jgi:hypothetical protein